MMQDEIHVLREENAALREENARLRALVAELLPLKTQVEQLNTQVKQLESRLAKDSHNSHLPPSSDRFARQPNKTSSLRNKSGKKAGAQPGHEGNTLYQVSEPDQVMVHAVEACPFCQHDLQAEPVLQVERRRGWDLPP
jgi:transposase